jgi:hypothetical protein
MESGDGEVGMKTILDAKLEQLLAAAMYLPHIGGFKPTAVGLPSVSTPVCCFSTSSAQPSDYWRPRSAG